MVSLCSYLAESITVMVVNQFMLAQYPTTRFWERSVLSTCLCHRHVANVLQSKLPFFCALFLVICLPMRTLATDDNELLTAWLNAQTNIHTWSADFVQTPHL